MDLIAYTDCSCLLLTVWHNRFLQNYVLCLSRWVSNSMAIYYPNQYRFSIQFALNLDFDLYLYFRWAGFWSSFLAVDLDLIDVSVWICKNPGFIIFFPKWGFYCAFLIMMQIHRCMQFSETIGNPWLSFSKLHFLTFFVNFVAKSNIKILV